METCAAFTHAATGAGAVASGPRCGIHRDYCSPLELPGECMEALPLLIDLRGLEGGFDVVIAIYFAH